MNLSQREKQKEPISQLTRSIITESQNEALLSTVTISSYLTKATQVLVQNKMECRMD